MSSEKIYISFQIGKTLFETLCTYHVEWKDNIQHTICILTIMS
jgi:hypothetical protein